MFGVLQLFYQVQIMMDFISWCDGKHSLLDIGEIMKVPVWELYDTCEMLEHHKLIEILKK